MVFSAVRLIGKYDLLEFFFLLYMNGFKNISMENVDGEVQHFKINVRSRYFTFRAVGMSSGMKVNMYRIIHPTQCFFKNIYYCMYNIAERLFRYVFTLHRNVCSPWSCLCGDFLFFFWYC